MFFIEKERKQEDAISEDGFREEETRKRIKLDFAHILFIGLKIGYKEEEVRHMYFGKWSMLYKQFQMQWNMQMKKMLYAEKQEEISTLDL